jgi:hypothetical protein
MRWRLSENGAILIYLILITGVAAILIAWRMLPKEASVIVIIDTGGKVIQTYAKSSLTDSIRYKLDDTALRVFQNGQLHIHPMVGIQRVDIEH